MNTLSLVAALIDKGYSVQDALRKVGEVGDFFFSVSEGNVPGYSAVTKFGYNESVGTSEEVVWSQSGALTYLASAEQMNIVSTDVNDDGDPASTGALTLTIQGLDGNYVEIEETVTLNGTTNVLTTNSYLRVHRMYVRTVGSSGYNEGTITATAATAGTIQAHIPATAGQTQQCFYTVPAGKTAYVIGGRFSWVKTSGGGGSAAELRVRGYIRSYNSGYESWRRVFDQLIPLSGNNPSEAPQALSDGISEKSDIQVRSLVDAGSANVDARLYIVLKDS